MYFINKLLELSQTENELREPVLKKFDVINMLNSLVKFNEQLYKGKEVRWNVNIESNLKNTVTSDEEIIKTILQNIIEVIIKSIDMGDVSVDLSLATEELLIEKGINKDDSYLLFDISSNSLLLSESDLESMFDPYKIVDTPNRKNLLRAIMLACVKNLVQTLNGHVWVKSQILKNTSFNILIPQN